MTKARKGGKTRRGGSRKRKGGLLAQFQTQIKFLNYDIRKFS